MTMFASSRLFLVWTFEMIQQQCQELISGVENGCYCRLMKVSQATLSLRKKSKGQLRMTRMMMSHSLMTRVVCSAQSGCKT